MLVSLEGVGQVVVRRHTKAERQALARKENISEALAGLILAGLPSGGAGFTDALEQAILNHVMLKTTYTPPANWFAALSSTTPTEAAGNFTEPSGGAYARVSTAGADWAAASGTAPAVVSNANAITFPTATADWVSAANLTYFGLFSVSTAGSVSIFGQLTTAKPVLNGDTASFAVGALVVKLGDPGDTY